MPPSTVEGGIVFLSGGLFLAKARPAKWSTISFVIDGRETDFFPREAV
jgi:hypothetical protein